MNGIPLSPTSGIPHRSPGAISGDVLRSKNKKRDDAIRKKVCKLVKLVLFAVNFEII